MRRMWTRAILMGSLGLIAGGAIGCAEERPPINRVQANALSKAFFVGDLHDASDDPEFYFRGTVVDVDYGAAQDGLFTSTYAQPVSRIRWEITENALNARLAYERVEDTDGKGNKVDGLRRKLKNDGQIVASYRISSHFDIRRAYNPSTGEEQNIVEENASDRPWYERQHFRVDWSENLITNAYDFDTLSMLGIFGGIQYSSLKYADMDPYSPDAPHFDAESGYFDITIKAYAEPAQIDLSSLGWGIDKFPACFLDPDFSGGTAPAGNCNPTELKIRQSFRRVVDKDYEPVDWDGYRFQAFGAFTTERSGYDRLYGHVDSKWHRFANLYNIWERSHFYTDPANMTGEIACATEATTTGPTQDPNADPNRDLKDPIRGVNKPNGTADECEAAGPGSRCDVYNHKCTLPFRERKTVTIPWYINGASTEDLSNLDAQLRQAYAKSAARPEESEAIHKEIADIKLKMEQAQAGGESIFEATNWAVEEWDLTFKAAVQTARLVECRKTGGQDCDAAFPMWKGQQEDIDEAVKISRDLNACYRANGWGAESCIAAAKSAAQAVATERGAAGDPSTLAIGEVAAMQPMIVLCHNPVISSDNPACGAPGTYARLGDLRYNTVLAIDKPQTPSAWGIMVDADDPLTGEKVAASINIWTHVTDLASQGLLDLVRYVNGELTTSQITNGKYIQDWVQASKLGASHGPTMSRQEVTARLASATKLDAAAFETATKNGLPAPIAAQVKQYQSEVVADVAVDADLPSPSAIQAQARMTQARGTPVESKLMNRPMLEMAGMDGNTPVAGPLADKASPLALNNPKLMAQLRQMRENALAQRGACMLNEAPEASAVPAIAAVLLRKFPIPENESAAQRLGRHKQMLDYIRRRFHYAVIAHEMGHSVGLRHNFVSTSASLFYRPQYWQLRTKNGKMVDECVERDANGLPKLDANGQVIPTAYADGGKCTGPRYYDPVTKEEDDQLIWMFMHSSVMDYPGDLSQDMVGLGVYDFAATRMFYTDTAAVYDVKTPVDGHPAKDYTAGGRIGTGISTATDTFGGLLGIRYGTRTKDFIHYSQLQKEYGVIHDCYPVTPKQPASWNEAVDGIWDPLLDGQLVQVDGEYTKCRQLPVDYVSWDQMRMPTSSELGGSFYRGGKSVDPATKRLRVPYGFATDHWADTGNVSVFRHDNGADPYEQVMFLITSQENRHILDNYRRGRTSFNVRGAAGRSFSRYNEKLLGISGGIGFFATIYHDLATNQGYSFDTLWPFLIKNSIPDNVIAATVAMDHFTRQLSRPEAGEHYRTEQGKVPSATGSDRVLRSNSDTDDYGPNQKADIQLIVPNGSTGYLKDIGFGGRPLENTLSDENGDYDSQYTMNAGAYYDKINTAILLNESEDRFISQSRRDFYDARFRAVGMADVLPDGYRRILANALTTDRSLLAPHITAKNGKPETMGVEDPFDPGNLDPKMFPLNPVGWTSWWPTEGPKVCFPSNGKNLCYGYGGDGGFNPLTPGATVTVDPQVGWEVQKFLIAWTLAYIPANEKTNWLDMMRIYRLGQNNDPAFDQRIEWQDPSSGQLYYARTYGKECLFGSVGTVPAGTPPDQIEAVRGQNCVSSGGRWVEKGIAARVLEHANWLTSLGYQLNQSYCPSDLDPNDPTYSDCTVFTKPGTPRGFNAKGRAIFMSHPDGTAIIVPDASIQDINTTGTAITPVPPCDQNVDASCTQLTIYKNHWAYELSSYKSVPDYLWEVMVTFKLGTPDQLGVFDF